MNKARIRKSLPTETEAIIKLWLNSNIQAHPFIDSGYWISNVDFMREALPSADVYIYEQEGEIAGFIGLNGHHIEGLFVDPRHQSKGIGTSLIEFIKQQHFTLTLTTYKKNEKTQQFYRKHNFVVIKERIDNNTDEAELLMRWNRACPI